MRGVAIRQVSQKRAIGSAGTAPIKTLDPRAVWPEESTIGQAALTAIYIYIFFPTAAFTTRYRLFEWIFAQALSAS